MEYILILLSTIFIASRKNLLLDNITGVASKPEWHIIIIIYTFICALFFAFKTYKIYKNLPSINNYCFISIALAAILMISGSFFTYHTNQKDISSLIHVSFSMISCSIFLVLLWIHAQKTPYQKITVFFNRGLQFLIIIILFFTRINGIVEILFTTLVCGYLYSIEKQL